MSIPRHKVLRVPEFKEVRYSVDRWGLLSRLRAEALKIMGVLIKCGFKPITHGSIARGDVSEGSDVDIVIPYNVQPYEVELCLDVNGIAPSSKYVVQATPTSTPKAYVELDPSGLRTISFPLLHLTPREYEFYRFGGLLSYEELVRGLRVPGVSKQLLLIEPTDYGHRELPVVGYEDYVAKVIGVSLETVLERVKALSKRDVIGRTGVYLKYVLRVDEVFEEAVRTLIKSGKIRL